MTAFLRHSALLALLAAALVPAKSHASPFSTASMSAFAGPTRSLGDACQNGGSQTSSNLPSFLAQEASWTCHNVEGDDGGHASADVGVLKANAFSFSRAGIDRGSVSAHGMVATASYSDTAIFSNNTGQPAQVVLVTPNVNFSATASASGLAGANVDAFAEFGGEFVVHCFATGSVASQCDRSPVFVPVGVPVFMELTLEVLSFANASGQLEDASALADASHTFSFPLNGPVFDLPPGFTVNAPNSFIFDNIYSPPSAVAAAVPEPGTVSLLLAGLGGLLLTRRRRRHNGAT